MYGRLFLFRYIKQFSNYFVYFLITIIIILICYYHYITSVIYVQTYIGIRHGGQHDSDLLGLSTGLQRSIITYTYNIVSTVWFMYTFALK